MNISTFTQETSSAMTSLSSWRSLKYVTVAVTALFAYCINCLWQINDLDELGPLRKCLALTLADVSYPSNETWWYDSQGVSVPVLRHPFAVAYATSTLQVTLLVTCAVQNKVKPVPRSGGHSVEAFSSLDGKLVIDISRINFIEVDPDRQTAHAGAGIRLGKLYYETGKHRLGFPAGNCPSVGLGGHVAVGGYGDLTNAWGLAADNVLSMTFIDWCGHLLVANATHHSDLFFALRAGGGGSYGIVTEMTLKLRAFPKSSTAFSVSWERFPTTSDFIGAWFTWKPWRTMPAEMKLIALVSTNGTISGLYVGDDGKDGVARVLNTSGLMAIGHRPTLLTYTSTNLLLARAWLLNFNQHYGDERDYQVLNTAAHTLQPLNLPPYPVPVHPTWTPLQNDTTVNNTQTNTWTLGPIPQLEAALIDRDYYKYTSQMITKEFNEQLMGTQLQEFMDAGGISLWEPHVGLMTIEPEIPNAFAHRKALFNVQHFVPYDASSSVDGEEGVRRQHQVCHKLASAMEAFSNHTSYQGYPDLYWTTNPRVYMPRYYGPHVDRLIAIKNKYDPLDHFSNPQSIPLKL